LTPQTHTRTFGTKRSRLISQRSFGASPKLTDGPAGQRGMFPGERAKVEETTPPTPMTRVGAKYTPYMRTPPECTHPRSSGCLRKQNACTTVQVPHHASSFTAHPSSNPPPLRSPLPVLGKLSLFYCMQWPPRGALGQRHLHKVLDVRTPKTGDPSLVSSRGQTLVVSRTPTRRFRRRNPNGVFAHQGYLRERGLSQTPHTAE